MPRRDIQIDVRRDAWMQRRWLNALGWMICGFWAVAWPLMGIAFVALAFESSVLWVLAVPLALWASFGSARLAFGCYRAGLLVTESEVVVRNPQTTNAVSLEGIEKFDVDYFSSEDSAPLGIVVLLKDGTKIAVWSLGSGVYVRGNGEKVKQRWVASAEELNSLL